MFNILENRNRNRREIPPKKAGFILGEL